MISSKFCTVNKISIRLDKMEPSRRRLPLNSLLKMKIGGCFIPLFMTISYSVSLEVRLKFTMYLMETLSWHLKDSCLKPLRSRFTLSINSQKNQKFLWLHWMEDKLCVKEYAKVESFARQKSKKTPTAYSFSWNLENSAKLILALIYLTNINRSNQKECLNK